MAEQDIVDELREEYLRLAGQSIDRGSLDSGLSANLASAAADEIERLRDEAIVSPAECGEECADPDCLRRHEPLTLKQAYENAVSRLRDAEETILQLRAANNGHMDLYNSTVRDINRLRERNEELERQVYVPGMWRCAKCNFSLIQSNLNARDGTVSANDKPGENCPNCDVPLWRVTERQAGNEMVERAEDYLQRAGVAKRLAMGRCSKEARRYASHYRPGSDGRNTLNMLADTFERWATETAEEKSGG